MDIKEVLQKFISQELLNGHQLVSTEDNLLTDDILDSLGVISLVIFIEKQFEINVPPEDILIENFRTINVITNYIEGRCLER